MHIRGGNPCLLRYLGSFGFKIVEQPHGRLPCYAARPWHQCVLEETERFVQPIDDDFVQVSPARRGIGSTEAPGRHLLAGAISPSHQASFRAPVWRSRAIAAAPTATVLSLISPYIEVRPKGALDDALPRQFLQDFQNLVLTTQGAVLSPYARPGTTGYNCGP
jgi:hypothetical protein